MASSVLPQAPSRPANNPPPALVPSRQFRAIDEDGTGSISGAELSVAMGWLGNEVSADAAQALIAEVDTDGSGEIEFAEFVVLMTMFQDGGGGELGSFASGITQIFSM